MKKKSKKKKWFIWGGIILIIILVIVAINKKQNTKGIKVSTELVEKRTIIESVSANGKIQPEIDVSISPYISGEVVELYVKEGEEVKKGDFLAKIDPEIYISNYERVEASLNTQRANLANSKARLVQSKAQYINSKNNFKRNETLYNQDVISAADFDAAKSSYEVSVAEVEAAKESVKAAEYSVNSAQASLKEANENLIRTSIFAPNNGTVSKLNVEKGERVTGASQFSSGTEIMRIANLQEMEVNVEVNENDIVRVALGDTSIIEVDAYLNKKFKGIVTEIATSANTLGVSVDQVTNFDVKIRILRESYKDLIPENNPRFSPLRPGMSATVDIQTETALNISTLPIQAVTTRADTTGKEKSLREKREEEKSKKEESKEDEEFHEYVFLYDNGIAKMQEVKTGIQNNTFIEITEGLEDGQEVIVAPYRAVSKKLKNGDEVKKVPKKDLFASED